MFIIPLSCFQMNVFVLKTGCLEKLYKDVAFQTCLLETEYTFIKSLILIILYLR